MTPRCEDKRYAYRADAARAALRRPRDAYPLMTSVLEASSHPRFVRRAFEHYGDICPRRPPAATRRRAHARSGRRRPRAARSRASFPTVSGCSRDAEEAEAVDQHGRRELARDDRRRHAAGAEVPDGEDRRRDDGDAACAAAQRPPRGVRDLAQPAEPARGDADDHGQDQRARPRSSRTRPARSRRSRPSAPFIGACAPTAAPAATTMIAAVVRSIYLASSQVRPTPASTASGGSRSPHGATISRSTARARRPTSSGGPSNSSSSWIVSSSRVARPSAASARVRARPSRA